MAYIKDVKAISRRKRNENFDLVIKPIQDDKPVKKRKKDKVKLTHIGDKILDKGLHVIFSREITYSEYLNNRRQIHVPEGYKLVAFSNNDDLLANNYVVFENRVPVKVKVYRNERGEEFSPEFGTPIE